MKGGGGVEDKKKVNRWKQNKRRGEENLVYKERPEEN